jgi:hypothetical protein
MRYLLLRSLAALVCLGVLSLSQASAANKPDQPDKPNFSGAWVIDLQASTSLDPLMTQIGAGFLDRKYAAHTKLKATLEQTADVLTISARWTFKSRNALGKPVAELTRAGVDPTGICAVVGVNPDVQYHGDRVGEAG